MQKHKYNIFPDMQPEEYERLKKDLHDNGFDNNRPIYLFNNEVLDGWQIQKACDELNITPMYKNFIGTDEEAFNFVVSRNINRRHLTSSQRAAIAVLAVGIYKLLSEQTEKERREKQALTLSDTLNNKGRILGNLLPNINKDDLEQELIIKSSAPLKEWADFNVELPVPYVELPVSNVELPKNKIVAMKDIVAIHRIDSGTFKITTPNEYKWSFRKIVEILYGKNSPQLKNYDNNRTDTKMANLFGTNRRYFQFAKKLYEGEDFETFEIILSGKNDIPEIRKEEKINNRVKELEKIKHDIETENLFIDDKFDVVVIDPPWPYDSNYDPDYCRVANPYLEMSLEEIKAVDIPAKDNSILYLWATSKFLPDAFKILEYWGFEYKATLVWNKKNMGMGHYFRHQIEYCLACIKGKPQWNNTEYRDIIEESGREHSRKPEAFYSMVEKINYGTKIDYFSREQRDGWYSFGIESKKFNKVV